MNESRQTPYPTISVVTMVRFLWMHRVIIAICVAVGAVAAGAIAFSLTPKYRSEVVFSQAADSQGLGDLNGQLGGLASLAGINVGARGGGGKKSEEALEYLRSHVFTRQFIERHGLMPVLFSGKWDAQRRQWSGEPPTMAEGVSKFANKVRQIAEDRRTGIVTLSMTWGDRFAAAQWANDYIAEADDALRQRAIAELGRSIDYLKAEAARASVVEVQAAVYRVMESELKDAMVARTSDAYAFKVVDPAVARDRKDKESPNKPLFVVLGSGFGFVFGVLWASSRQRKPERREP